MAKTSVPVNSDLSVLQKKLDKEVENLDKATVDTSSTETDFDTTPSVPFKKPAVTYPTETSAMVGKAMTEDARRTKEALDKEPRIVMSIPLSPGEKAGQAEEYAAINGYGFYMKKGVMISLPQSIAVSLMEHYNIQQGEAEKGREYLVSRDASAEHALR